jgi:cbb3-type cytochrome oxidase maturation protein
MDSLYLLIPLSAGLVLVILAVFGWAVHRGQFEDLDYEGERILADEAASLDVDQGGPQGGSQESPIPTNRPHQERSP